MSSQEIKDERNILSDSKRVDINTNSFNNYKNVDGKPKSLTNIYVDCDSTVKADNVSKYEKERRYSEGAPTSNIAATASAISGSTTARPSPLPYTFYRLHGKNIKLRSSDTVALRTEGYRDAIAIVSTPLLRGQVCRFRVDKLDQQWAGGALVGALPNLPVDGVPRHSLHFHPPAWIIACDVVYENGFFTQTLKAAQLDALEAGDVLSLRFTSQGLLTLDISDQMVICIGRVPAKYKQVYPLIDVYGKVTQVSILLNPRTLQIGKSLDVPSEYQEEKNIDETLNLSQLGLDESNEAIEILAGSVYERVCDKQNKRLLALRRYATVEEKVTENPEDPIIDSTKRHYSIHSFCPERNEGNDS